MSLALMGILTLISPVRASVTYYRFPIPPEVQQQVQFWHSIFAKHSSYQSVVHDRDLPNIIIDVIDYQKFAKFYNESVPYTSSEQKRIRKKYIDRYQMAIDRFKREGKKAVRHGPMEERVTICLFIN